MRFMRIAKYIKLKLKNGGVVWEFEKLFHL